MVQAKELKTIVYLRAPTEEKMDREIGDTLTTAYRSGELWIEDEYQNIRDLILNGIDSPDRGHVFTVENNDLGEAIGVYYDNITPTTAHELPGLSSLVHDIKQPESQISHLCVSHADRLITVKDGSKEKLHRYRTVVTESEVETHIHQGFTLHCGTDIDNALGAALKVAAQIDNVTGERKHTGGRPPFGFTAVGGQLQTTEDYPQICAVLQRVVNGDTSKRQAAETLGCARRTIDNAIAKPWLYDLQK